MFADLVGFTAWSSVREPTQVFVLLETIYRAFDEIAQQLRVFKVETVGDCYVAMAGLPEARKDHAVVMVKFAYDCIKKASEVTRKLEVLLGPDTADL
jgi:class 3 adenylate cyclase